MHLGNTPVRALHVPFPGRTSRIWLKLESENRFGSIKARTAHALLGALEATGRLRPGQRVVESSSGNLGVALAGLCASRGYRCTLVIEPSTPDQSIKQMIDFGAELVRIEAEPWTNAVRARVAAVHEIVDRDANAVWTNQYESVANPEVHRRWTAPELLRDTGNAIDAVAIAVSTGGTLAGVAEHLRRHRPGIQLIAVDAVGSAATGAAGERPYKVPGFGSGLRSAFLTRTHWDHLVRLDDLTVAQACRTVHKHTGLMLGGSSAAAMLAAVMVARRRPELRDVACICADGGEKYTDIYRARPLPCAHDDDAAAALDYLAESRLE